MCKRGLGDWHFCFLILQMRKLSLRVSVQEHWLQVRILFMTPPTCYVAWQSHKWPKEGKESNHVTRNHHLSSIISDLTLVTPASMPCLLVLQTRSQHDLLSEPTPAASCIPESVKDSTLHSRAQIRNLGVRLNVSGYGGQTVTTQVPVVNWNKTCLIECWELFGE